MITTYLVAHNDQGQFIHGLQPADLSVQENDRTLPVVELSELRQGVQMVVAVNPATPFAIRDSQGISRYDLLAGALKGWVSSRQGSTLDDLSFLATDGPEITHTPDPMAWLSTLESYQPDARAVNPSLDILMRAVEVAGDPTLRPGMGCAVLFITAPMEGDITPGVQNLIDRATALNVRIFVWLVASPDVFDTPKASSLAQLANSTGGEFFPFSGVEQVANLENYLEPLRNVYRLSYASQIGSGGLHQLRVDFQHGGEQFQTPVQSFEFALQPPDPAFISPDLVILRTVSLEISKNLLEKVNPANLYPKEYPLRVLIDFPDGHPRPLVKSSLYVDQQVVAVNTSPPFDEFTWDLSAHTQNGQHLLRVEVVDSMGLVGTSMELPFQIRVEQQSNSALAYVIRYWPVAGGLAILLLGAGLFLALILGGRIHPQARNRIGRSRQRRRSANGPPARPVQPEVLQPAPGLDPQEPGNTEPVDGRLTGWVNRLHWPQRRLAPTASAFLTRMSDSSPAADTAVPIPVTVDELTFGKDPHQAILVLDDPSVDALHARLIRREDGTFQLSDEGSVAGTWINYNPILQDNVCLEHGDLIHIGRVGFRFTQREPVRPRRPVVTLEKPLE